MVDLGSGLLLAILVAIGACYLQFREQALEARLQAALKAHAVAPQASLGAAPQKDLAAEVDPGRLLYQTTALEFALVSDLDKASKNADGKSWHAWLQRGILYFEPTPGSSGDGNWRLEWLGVDRLKSKFAAKGRGLELSELVRFNGDMFAVCDTSGIVYKVDVSRKQAYPRQALAEGDGDNEKPFKVEWATVKDGALLVGSMGREWYREDGSIENFNNQWVKHLDASGGVRSANWRPVFEALRTATNTSSPGYLWHEAVEWDPRHRRWVILPRKASESEPFDDTLDEKCATNLLLLASEDFSSIEVRRLGPLELEWGVSAVRKVPGTDATFIALKAREVDGQTATKVVVFDIPSGAGAEPRMLLTPPMQPVGGSEEAAAVKYEGLDFLHDA